MLVLQRKPVDRVLADSGIGLEAISMMRSTDPIMQKYMAAVLLCLSRETSAPAPGKRARGVSAETLYHNHLPAPDSLAMLEALDMLRKTGLACITNASAVISGSKAAEYAITESGRACMSGIRARSAELTSTRRRPDAESNAL